MMHITNVSIGVSEIENAFYLLCVNELLHILGKIFMQSCACQLNTILLYFLSSM